ncbi:tripartite tricarboxylate transporter substrate binding protein [Pseudoroseomonas cervicalis]|uniref:Bug family tripartite tricarboxylate transporter substrate binding protein n=1 Tax=Teichococcus cervicalis TaxID=204525 RepID=UPI00278B2A55|nr:tripartite tricarboxylate transporter substrate binding protein [Pseudoroseomonas cervicalis]MDQ1079444.1 tripartite-type tricarboxylate transporter receptor subunit TctC [Pseudoroseomonas cervicalis]
MHLTRRGLLAASLGALATPALAPPARAQAFPNRPVRIVVPFPPGGGTDNLTRLVAERLSAALGWSVVVENKPGAGGNVALDGVAKSRPDGYTMVMAQTDNVVLNPLTYSRLPYDPDRDLMPVGLIASGAAVLVVRADAPWKSLAEFTAAAREKRGQLTFGSPGIGTVSHLILELWQRSAGIQLNHIPYRGIAQSLPDLINGQIDSYMGSIPTLRGHIEGGRVRALAVSSGQRSATLPEVPTFREAGIEGVELASVWGLMAPTGTPQEIVEQVNAAVNRMIEEPETRKRIVESGADVLGGTPAAMGQFYASERERLGRVVRDANIRLE